MERPTPTLQDRWTAAEIDEMVALLVALREQMLHLENIFSAEIDDLPKSKQPSSRNLLHYVALRRNDVRNLQEELVRLGLSSLGRCEAHVLENIDCVLEILLRLSGRESDIPHEHPLEVELTRARKRLRSSTERLFGISPEDRAAHIMVTMPSEAASDYKMVRDLVKSGMNCMRINCAHDDESDWSRMIEHLRRAEQELGKTCRVMMDLAGPKLRTGDIENGPQVVKIRPQRDQLGRVVQPAQVWLHLADQPVPEERASAVAIPLLGERLPEIAAGDWLTFRDARQRKRLLRVAAADSSGVLAESDRTAYVTPDMQLLRVASKDDPTAATEPFAKVANLPPLEQAVLLRVGDQMRVTRPEVIGKPATRGEDGAVLEPARIGCTLPSIFKDVKPGERVLFDDGKIETMIKSVDDHGITLVVTRALPKGDKLRGDKGINLPDSDLNLDALTEKDQQDLEFIVKHADAVAYSFVRRAEDVAGLQQELQRLGRPEMGVILKIENRQAAERLPSLLWQVLHSESCGVMIARGDLMVECGWQRMAELQEQILWMCEAAHLPVIWATQVLEGLAKRGLPSRAEVTDAAMGVRAECVMLNKGPNIVGTVRSLCNILQRMQDHQIKKRPMLRRLRIADNLLPEEAAS